MSTINAQNYGDGTDSVPASAVLEGTAKAAAFVFSDATLGWSYNVSSGVDNGTGDYSINYTNSLGPQLYSTPCSHHGSGAVVAISELQNASQNRFRMFNTAAVALDARVQFATFGDLS